MIKYAGLDEEYSRMFAMEIFDKLVKGLDFTNTAGEHVQFDPQDIGDTNMAKLEPTSAGRMQDFSPLMARPWHNCRRSAMGTSYLFHGRYIHHSG